MESLFGLKSIPSVAIADSFILLTNFFICTFTVAAPPKTILLIITCLIYLASTGWTKDRWTIYYPMALLMILQLFSFALSCSGTENANDMSMNWMCKAVLIRQFIKYDSFTIAWVSFIVKVLSLILILLSVIFSILFPAVDIADISERKYNCGVIDLYLPVKYKEEDTVFDKETIKKVKDRNGGQYIKARLLYPTHEKTRERIPYLEKATADKVCAQFVDVGESPLPTEKLSFLLNHWKLSTIQAQMNAKLINTDEKIPIVIFSHGLTGSIPIYSYQAMNLAVNGMLVLLIDHTDGSGIGTRLYDGSYLPYDKSPFQKKNPEYIRLRRSQANYRAVEYMAAAEALRDLNFKNIPILSEIGISFVGKLNVNEFIAAGHSFGASTAITIAARCPEMFSSVVAHDPASDWMPDDVRMALFENHRLGDLSYTGGTGGYDTNNSFNKSSLLSNVLSKLTNSSKERNIHDMNLCFLFSEEFYRNGWGGSKLLQKMKQRDTIVSPNHVSCFEVIKNTCHVEFSDMGMLTPLWLSRLTGMCNKNRNTHDTAKEIGKTTLRFLVEASSNTPKKVQ